MKPLSNEDQELLDSWMKGVRRYLRMDGLDENNCLMVPIDCWGNIFEVKENLKEELGKMNFTLVEFEPNRDWIWIKIKKEGKGEDHGTQPQ